MEHVFIIILVGNHWVQTSKMQVMADGNIEIDYSILSPESIVRVKLVAIDDLFTAISAL